MIEPNILLTKGILMYKLKLSATLVNFSKTIKNSIVKSVIHFRAKNKNHRIEIKISLDTLMK